jgi:hypothetical protein
MVVSLYYKISYTEPMKLKEISDLYRETADSFLKSSKLVSVLEKYGRIEFEGAYAGNVMLHGDVDIKVIKDVDFTLDELFAILKDVHDTCGDNFRSLFVKADWDDPRLGHQFPNGRYIGLKTYVNVERWKFDIWSKPLCTGSAQVFLFADWKSGLWLLDVKGIFPFLALKVMRNVFLDHFGGDIARTADKVATGPEVLPPVPFLEFREFHLQFSTHLAFEILYDR